jgi:hypothetical protein
MTAERATRPSREKTLSAPQVAVDPLRPPILLVPAVQPSGARLVGRVFGYLGLTLLWLVLLAVALFATVAALPGAAASAVPEGGLVASPAVTRADSWLWFVIMPLLVVPFFGSVTVFLVLATFGMLLSSAMLFVRSLNPAYRHEQLSVTVWSVGGEAAGPGPTLALSLVPVRLTRWSKVVAIVQFNGWILNGTTLAIGYIWGLVYFFTFVWTLWPAEGAAVPICQAVTGLLVAWLVFEIWRRRHRFPAVMPAELRGTAFERSWPNRPVAEPGTKNRTTTKPTKKTSRPSSPSA